MASIGIRELQKISGETIGALEGPTTITSGARTVALLIPLKTADPNRLAAVLRRAEQLARGHDPVEDDAALASYGPVDSVDWSIEAVRALTAKR
jgi:antitoxin (DNA-binding transcriptional repressor) of toxin-antitoxin stability system